MSAQIEATCDAIYRKIENGIGLKIEQINAEDTEGLLLEPPALITIGPRSEIPYPCVQIMPADSENIVDTGGGRVHFLHRIRLVSWLQHADEESLTRLLIRYARAVREVTLTDRRPAEALGDPAGYALSYESDEYGPFITEDPAVAFQSWVATTVAVRQQQDLY